MKILPTGRNVLPLFTETDVSGPTTTDQPLPTYQCPEIWNVVPISNVANGKFIKTMTCFSKEKTMKALE